MFQLIPLGALWATNASATNNGDFCFLSNSYTSFFFHNLLLATGQLLRFAWPGARGKMEAHLPHVKEPGVRTQREARKPRLVTTGKQSLLWKNLLLLREEGFDMLIYLFSY